ncbi:Peroxin 13, N-terminal region-domain-containing protein [Flagelloscypha sp. PMI_526]|nr:Peroxin 13, N-terminal region-domain-containing protein [Flagelloscypha sp. PMI_526]
MPSPPKPWELNGAAASNAVSTSSMPSTSTMPSVPASTPATAVAATSPSVPDRPAAFGQTPATAASTSYSAYGMSPYSRMGTYGGGYGSYGAGYGGYGSMGYGGMGGMGYGGAYSGYGSYGGFGGGMGMGMGMMGPMGMQPALDVNGMPIPSLTQTLEATTQHTFALLHSIVQTFGGVAQMLESTFMATHSSFFAMVGVIDQFGQLRNALGSVLGLFGLVRWMRDILTGAPPQGSLPSEFRDFVSGRPVPPGAPPSGPAPQKINKKPIIIFLLAIFGIPYAMTKLVKILAERARNQNGGFLPGQPLPPLDPSQLSFARSLYPFSPTNQSELALKENEIVAIVGKLDPRTGTEVDPRVLVEGEEWWKGRTRDGREGWFPKKWVEVLQRKDAVKTVD